MSACVTEFYTGGAERKELVASSGRLNRSATLAHYLSNHRGYTSFSDWSGRPWLLSTREAMAYIEQAGTLDDVDCTADMVGCGETAVTTPRTLVSSSTRSLCLFTRLVTISVIINSVSRHRPCRRFKYAILHKAVRVIQVDFDFRPCCRVQTPLVQTANQTDVLINGWT